MSLRTVNAHNSCVYQALFSPHTPQVIASCSTDGTIKIFDLRQPQSSAPNLPTNPALVVPAHASEILSIDWNKYRPFVIASASVDRTVKVWDCRMVKLGEQGGAGAVGGVVENDMKGHEYAVRKVQWSPHRADLLATASYDMTCRVYVPFQLLSCQLAQPPCRWLTSTPPMQPNLRSIHDLHTEFVVGCAWSLYDEGVLASCSWDHTVQVHRPVV